MKVLHLYKSYYPETLGGVEQLIYSLSKELVKHEVTSDVITTSRKKKSYIHSVQFNKVFFFPRTLDLFSCPISVAMLKQVGKIAQNYNILHYHFPWPFADLMHLVSHINKPSVLTYHSDIVKQKTLNILYQPLMQQFLKKMNCIVTTSNNLLQSSPVLANYKDKTKVIPIGMSLEAPPANSSEQLAQWASKFKQPFFLFVGVLRYYKGLNFLLEAVKDTNISIVIAGTGPEELRLKEIANRFKLQNVHFVGRISEADKWALLELCYAVIAPSHLRTEAFCISLLEGLMHGKPLISTELGTGTSFVNIDKLTGFVVAPKDPLALRQAMQTLLVDKNTYEKFKKETMPHYHAHFTAAAMAEQYFHLYQALIKENSCA